VAVPEEADVRAASWLAKLIRLAGMAPHCNTERGLQCWRQAEQQRAVLPSHGSALAGRGHRDGLMGAAGPTVAPQALGGPLPPGAHGQSARSRAWRRTDRTETGSSLAKMQDRCGAETSMVCPSPPPQPPGHAAFVLPAHPSWATVSAGLPGHAAGSAGRMSPTWGQPAPAQEPS